MCAGCRAGRANPPHRYRQRSRAVEDGCLPVEPCGRESAHRTTVRQPGIRPQVRTVVMCLERWGFTPQKPVKKSCEQRP